MSSIKKVMGYPLYWIVLKPLISVNYYLRKNGLVRDQWFWADTLRMKLGHY